MKCSKCGAELEADSVFCEKCGQEVRIVPDYNPLEEVLTENMKKEINFEESDRIRQDQSTDITKINAKKQRHKRNKKKMVVVSVIVGLTGVLGFLLYQNSYLGQLNKGYSLLEEQHYNAALKYFKSAVKAAPLKEEPYIAIAKTYMKKNQSDRAEEAIFTGIGNIPDNADLYKFLAEYYLDSGREDEIALILSGCDPHFLKNELKKYYAPGPKFSKEAGEYSETVHLKLKAEGCKIYYSLDGKKPARKKENEYNQTISLDNGKWDVRAYAVNKYGIEGPETEQEYRINIPRVDPPVIIPCSNLYEERRTITISVPDGFKAYYTMDGTKPDKNSEEYHGPVTMPEGNTIFMAVLVDEKGRYSEVGIRNYDLHINPPSQ